MMSVDKEAVLTHEAPIRLSPVFPAAISLSEQPQLAKPLPIIRAKNGLQPPDDSQPALPAPPPPPSTQRIGKRRYSMGVGFKGLTKRRRRANSDSLSESVLPSHFLLGGNIFDPLNLNSLLDEEVNRTTNQETPKCSPLPSRGEDPVEILVPRDITDPLNLKGGGKGGEDGRGVLLSPLKSKRKHRTRHHKVGGGDGEGDKEVAAAPLFPHTEGSVPPSPLPCELNTAITCRDDVAPSPILPRRHTHPPPGPPHKPGSQGDGRQRKRCGGPRTGSTNPREKKKKDKHRYQYGNHSRYYGYQGFYGDKWEGRVGAEEDPRLRVLEADWFRDKTVLDVGCGTGHMTLAVARRFNPTHILGVELDKQLVRAAIQNIRHFLSHDLVVEDRGKRKDTVAPPPPEQEGEEFQQALSLLSFPLSFRVSRGPLSAPPLLSPSSSSSSRFPGNITFIQGDYVSDREAWPGRGQYDVIMCLNVTKWVQLQSGDAGVVRLFKRAYQSLSPGGIFILEPQPWSSYCHSKRASVTPSNMNITICSYLRLRPEQFTSYLTDSVGFSSYRLITHTGDNMHIRTHQGSGVFWLIFDHSSWQDR
uniref:RNA methyltransferase n=1 Tax=Neolamprologus brichardi TaxID=32507 RepID=A0A3Q4GGS8_NEOBR